MSITNCAKSLTLYRSILKDEAVQAFLKISAEKNNREELYGQLFFKLAEASEFDQQYLTNGWQNHLLNLIIQDDNPFTRQAAVKGDKINPSLFKAALHDLKILQILFNDIDVLKDFDEMIVPTDNDELPGKNLSVKLSSAADWSSCIKDLIKHYHLNGVGIFGRYHALRWDGETKCLVGVSHPDPVQLSDLIGYQQERQQVLDNTEALLAGCPANNVLLYGDRGTGKSSTVKALIHAYGNRGLRLIEIPKQYLVDFPAVVQQLRTRPQYFILFIDDLSFEEFEVEYKALKAVLEGGLEARPKNVLIYATSNRRHLIRETFSDRHQDDIHAADTMQEKLSLADRFGLTVTFTAPDQKQYLEIVEGLAKQQGIEMDRSELHTLALQWELRHSGRSGRVAKQFIAYLEGKLKRAGAQ